MLRRTKAAIAMLLMAVFATAQSPDPERTPKEIESSVTPVKIDAQESDEDIEARLGEILGAIEGASDIDIDVPAHKVTRHGEQISLTPLEFDLLVALARKPRQVFTRDVLLEQVWGYRHPADTRLVNVHVQRLRAKVETDPENPQVVLTVRGVGYKAGPP